MRWIQLIRALPLLPFSYLEARKKYESDKEAYISCRKWSKRVLKAMGLTLEIEGSQNLEGLSGIFFVSNHQGTLDPAIIMAASPLPIRFISKLENESIPLLGLWARKIGCIHFDRDSREGNIHMLRQAIKGLKNNDNLLIFPEGTRSKKEDMNPFLEKALHPAIRTKSTIVPIALSHAYILDNKLYKGNRLKVIFSKPIPYEEYKDLEMEELSNQLHQWIESHIEK